MCVAQIQRQLNKAGLEDSPIRIFKNKHSYSILGELSFTIALDPKINDYAIEKIMASCPTNVFTIEEIEKHRSEEEKLIS